MLATLAQFKMRNSIGSADTRQDGLINGILTGVSAQLAGAAGRTYAGRPCLEKVSLTALLNVWEPRTEILHLPAWPVVSIASVTEALYGAFDDAGALTENEDYQVEPYVGALYRIGWWLKGRQCVQVVYVGGYTPPTDAPAWVPGADYAAGDRASYAGGVYDCTADVTGGTDAPPDDEDHWTVAAGEVALPDDIAEACITQSSFTWQRRDQLGLSSMGSAGGGVSAYAQDQLLPLVKDTMSAYRRWMG